MVSGEFETCETEHLVEPINTLISPAIVPKFEPLTVSFAPPDAGKLRGETSAMTGELYVNMDAAVTI
jgi:hypothetical protein